MILLSGDLDFPLSILGVDEAVVLKKALLSSLGVDVAHIAHQDLTVEAVGKMIQFDRELIKILNDPKLQMPL